MDASLTLYFVFLGCGIAQIFAFAVPMAVAARVPLFAVIATLSGWLPVLAAAIALHRSRLAAWIAIAGAAPAFLIATRAIAARQFGYAAFWGIPPVIRLRSQRAESASAPPFPGDPFRPRCLRPCEPFYQPSHWASSS